MSMRDLRDMSIDDAHDAHALLDAFDDAEWRATQKAKESSK